MLREFFETYFRVFFTAMAAAANHSNDDDVKLDYILVQGATAPELNLLPPISPLTDQTEKHDVFSIVQAVISTDFAIELRCQNFL